ncbi:hypothetical protein Rhe02_04540 [Rhizocola hellebori]|uniref:Sigma-70 family RNA polymerase sigma factor n=1 Tax=Rhizocola hellebori TaxID=1392758 RepID=A0A8J3Q2T0_9ACTN|nr:SigE family RNA polymerase sigma factor [Rhizocola hellebori]GIH02387.1 hypothetical protein Rhe02_04540 [Rhizocola hellebori]
MTIATARRQDEFNELYRANFGAIVAMAYSYTADLAEAQDIAQEAFSRAWQRWDALTDYDNPMAWVRHVTFNLAHSRWRKIKTATAYLVRQKPDQVDEMNPDHVAVVAALRKLPRQQREAIVWHHLADLSVQDVAHQLAVPVSTVKTWLQRGRALLAQELAIDMGKQVVTPPAEQVVQRARKQQRARRAAIVAVVVLLVAGVLAAGQLLRRNNSAPPVQPTPNPSSTVDSHDPLRAMDWGNVAIPGVPMCNQYSELPFRLDPKTHRSTWSDGHGGSISFAPEEIVFGDLDGDGLAEAIVPIECDGFEMGLNRSVLLGMDLMGGALFGFNSVPVQFAMNSMWITDGILYLEAAEMPNMKLGDVLAFRLNALNFEAVDGSTRYPKITSLDLSPVASQLACPSSDLQVPVDNDLVSEVGGVKWSLAASGRHPRLVELGRRGQPYLLLSVLCAPVGEESWRAPRTVLFDLSGRQWRAIATVTPPGEARIGEVKGNRIGYGNPGQLVAEFAWSGTSFTRVS